MVIYYDALQELRLIRFVIRRLICLCLTLESVQLLSVIENENYTRY